MTTEAALFLLRLVAGVLLLAVLGLLFVTLWRDYRSAAAQAENQRRSYGRLVVLQTLNGVYTPTPQSYPLMPITSFGRSPTNSITIDDSFASSEHAQIALRGGQWWLEDRQSRNGTSLNGLPVTTPTIITDGDIIGVGRMLFRLELEA